MFDRFKNFEIVPCGEINSKHHNFELVKYYQYNDKERCYVVAWIDWNDREPGWEFSSVGTRFIDDYEDGLCEYIKTVLALLEFTMIRKDEEQVNVPRLVNCLNREV